MIRPAWTRALSVLALGSVFMGGCGADPDDRASVTSVTTTTSSSAPPVASCESNREQILELLRSGLPSYDYTPAVNLREQVAASDVVLAGTVRDIARTSSGGEAWTTITVESPEVLHGGVDNGGSVARFAYTSLWPQGAGPDPLTDVLAFERVHVVAFLHFAERAPGSLVAGVQGLHVSCHVEEPPAAVIEPLPTDVRGSTFEDLVAEVNAASAAIG